MKVPWSDREWREVVVYGMGRSGLAAARLLRSRGVRVHAVDGRTEVAMGDLAGDPGIVLQLGDERSLPPRADGVVLSPGVPAAAPLVRAAAARGLPVIAEVELAYPFLDGSVIGITGSNGKSTTATLTAAMLEESGLPAVLCGNIGDPLAAQVGGPPGRIFVVELSSFQLETVRLFRADAAALLNLWPDHLDRHSDFAAYAAAKGRIFERQDESSTAVLNGDDPAVVSIGLGVEPARRRWFSRTRPVADGSFVDGETIVEAAPGSRPEELFTVGEMALRGGHNVENAMAASLLALAAGGDRSGLRRAVARFEGLEHRTRRIALRRGVAWYDDSKGTNVGATLKSLEGFDDGSVHLILGGLGKGQDFSPLHQVVARKAKAVYLIGADAAPIEAALAGAVPALRSETLERAVEAASAAALPGEVVLLSPACASFDQFTDFSHRGRRFRELVAALDADGSHG
ncbi:MAG TPA: UDP-N-acetylmuramoyl-L-alanine--D-glutamate ligase [Thermoanaerobaculia bacterium]|nr:UDP-N-acetylmuramoyl-L-alanine--D-glutamate ligase [Thermoanaerobaculia bacterium]